MAGGAHWWRMSPQERFDRQYMPEPNSGCWLWIGTVSYRGYGKCFWNGKHDLAHRVSWMLHRGSIPEENVICHRCDNKQCVNPEHLFIGTLSDNSKDMIAKNRGRAQFKPGFDVRRRRGLA